MNLLATFWNMEQIPILRMPEGRRLWQLHELCETELQKMQEAL